MKVVVDTMIWVSYTTHPEGFRHLLVEEANRRKVRFFVSEHILDELESTLVADFSRTPRYASLARRAILRIAKVVRLAFRRQGWVVRDPDDDPVVQTALDAKVDYLVTNDQEMLSLRQVEDVRIISDREFAHLIGFRSQPR